MGRKKDLKELGKRGPGRKAKKQPAPEILAHLKPDAESGLKVKKSLGGRIKQRARKRAVKLAAKAIEMEQKKKKTVRLKREKKAKQTSKEADEHMEMDGGSAQVREESERYVMYIISCCHTLYELTGDDHC